jgi:hypothetical protein
MEKHRGFEDGPAAAAAAGRFRRVESDASGADASAMRPSTSPAPPAELSIGRATSYPDASGSAGRLAEADEEEDVEETLIHERRSSASLSPERVLVVDGGGSGEQLRRPDEIPSGGRASDDDVALSEEWGVSEDAVCWLREHGLLHLGATLRDAGVSDAASLASLDAEGAGRIGLSSAEYEALSLARQGLETGNEAQGPSPPGQG